MRIINILIFSLLAFNMLAQNSPADVIFNKYSDLDGYTTVRITKYMFGLFANEESKKDKDEFAKIMSGLESIRILSVSDSVLNTKVNLYKELMKDFPINKYKEMMSIKEKDKDIKMLIREEKGKIVEFLMIGGGKSNFVICITGNIDLESISKLSKSMNIEGMENTEKLKDK
jgi:hypothetical protein